MEMWSVTKKLLFTAATIVALGAGGQAQANLVLNPGFETGDFTDWSASGWFVASSYGGVLPYEGSYFASTGCVGPSCIPGAYVRQSLPTTPGDLYNLSFAYNPGRNATETNTELQVQWNGAPVDMIFGGSLGYNVYTVNDLLATASSTVLEFNGRQDPAWLGLDAVSVVPAVATVPEPMSLALLGVGLAGLGAIRRRRKIV